MAAVPQFRAGNNPALPPLRTAVINRVKQNTGPQEILFFVPTVTNSAVF